MNADEGHDASSPAAAADAGPLVDDPRVVETVEEYLRELEAGRRPERDRYVLRHPELAEAVAECLDGLDLVRGGLSTAAGRTAAAHPPVGPETSEYLAAPLGDFQILREIARGGMGVVYEAVQLSLGRRVALKVLPFAATLDARQLQRFKNEAQAAALLHHTHIVPIYAVGCERGVHFYAMQLIEGQSLAVAIRQLREQDGRHAAGEDRLSTGSASTESASTKDWHEGPIGAATTAPVARANTLATIDVGGTVTAGAKISDASYVNRMARLVVQAAKALEHAHQAGVIHRDIKPGNLLVDAAANLWITDFGLAQLQADRGLTRSGEFLGTFRYVSPEQTRGQRTLLDHRTDVYSLGATFYELLTLEPVFPGESHQELLYEILHVEPRSPREWNRGVPPEIETIVLKALAKDPAERYQTAAELGADLQRFLDDRPILAKKPSPIHRARKWMRRHPSAPVAGVLLLIGLAAASLVSARMIAVEQRKTEAALNRERARAREVEQQYQLARQAVDSLFQISQEELADPPADAARRRILEIVNSYYQEFIDLRGNDPASLEELTRVQGEVREILAELNALQDENLLRLLDRGPVLDELGLSPEQQEMIAALLDDWDVQREEFRWSMRSLSDEERGARTIAAMKQRQADVANVLTAEQRARFHQLGLQWLGIFAFKEPEVIEALSLTGEQTAEIRRIERETFWRPFGPGEPQSVGRGRGGGRRGRLQPGFGRFQEVREDALHRALALLTDQQRARWEELTGPKFKRFGDSPFGPPTFDRPRW
jgi:serine/threonine protein kinase